MSKNCNFAFDFFFMFQGRWLSWLWAFWLLTLVLFPKRLSQLFSFVLWYFWWIWIYLSFCGTDLVSICPIFFLKNFIPRSFIEIWKWIIFHFLNKIFSSLSGIYSGHFNDFMIFIGRDAFTAIVTFFVCIVFDVEIGLFAGTLLNASFLLYLSARPRIEISHRRVRQNSFEN